MTWLGVDDTDGPEGGCTTFVLTEILRTAHALGIDPIGWPRLVRLNPNVPWKTRGNASLGVRLGHGRGRTHPVAQLPEGAIRGYSRGTPLPRRERSRVFDELWHVVERSCGRGSPPPDPALVLSPRQLPPSIYWTAVGREVQARDVSRVLEREGALVRAAGDGRGIIGAAAAISWPEARPTWEIITYRPQQRWGSMRRVDLGSVRRLSRAVPETFLSFDAGQNRLLVTPHTPCPILYGIRATSPKRLPGLVARVRSEPVERWCLFVSNQGTGDHVRSRAISELRPFDAAILDGEVADLPTVRTGGHWRFRLREPGGPSIDCWAFEPSKVLPSVVRQLVPGDRVRVWGGMGAEGPFRLEGVIVRHLAIRRTRGPNPKCPRCGRATHSAGRGRAFRCRPCRLQLPPESRADTIETTGLNLRRYDPVPSARRHLHPLAPEGERDATPWRAVVARSPRTDL
ncbi:MAG: tRNA(Ile)(2)-agmatinylcytidine synthase [Thermoplasmata archaeon]|nr:tRNA(Ile)(2)-agmatinylcytidine synthase [Thermoplasmata archaeon]